MALIEAFLIFGFLFLGAVAVLVAVTKATSSMWRMVFASQATVIRRPRVRPRVRMTPASLTMVKTPTLRHG